jgi:hypothetical protein
MSQDARMLIDLDSEHLPLIALWSYRTGQRRLASPEVLHVLKCHECLFLYELCGSSESMEEVERRLRLPHIQRTEHAGKTREQLQR